MLVLFTSTPGTGHIHPLLPLAGALRDEGHDVRFATGPDSCERVRSLGFPCDPAGTTRAQRAEAMAPHIAAMGPLAPADLRAQFTPMLFGTISAPITAATLGPIMDEHRPDLVIHDLLEFAAAPLAESRGIRHATVAFGLPLPEAVLDGFAAAAAPVWEETGLTARADAGIYAGTYLHALPDVLCPAPAEDSVGLIRPLHYDGNPSEPAPDWLTGFGRDQPGVYVTFGTEMGARAPWGPVVEALADLNVDAVLTTGGADIGDLGTLPPNVRVETYIRQGLLLDRVAVVASHGGSGTAWASAARGLPQLCLPLGADQWENAETLSAAGVGVTLGEGSRDSASIGTTLAGLLADTAVAERGAGVATAFAALPHPDEVAAGLVVADRAAVIER